MLGQNTVLQLQLSGRHSPVLFTDPDVSDSRENVVRRGVTRIYFARVQIVQPERVQRIVRLHVIHAASFASPRLLVYPV